MTPIMKIYTKIFKKVIYIYIRFVEINCLIKKLFINYSF